MDPRAQQQGDDSDEVLTVTTVVVEEEITVVEMRTAPRTRLHHVIAWLLLDRLRSLLTLFVLAVFVLTFIVQPFRIPSESMERTLLVGDFLLANKSIYGPAGKWSWLLPYRPPQQGDIVVFHFPLDPDDHVVKRVIGVAGDRVHLRGGIVYRDDAPLDEPYTVQQVASGYRAQSDAFRDDFPAAQFTDPGVDAHWWTRVEHSPIHGEVMVPPGQYFVMGDNREHSRDSRYWGFVPRENVVGMPMLIYFSVRQPSRFDGPVPPDDRLGKSEGSRLLDFARWDRTLRVVH
jgi:signal peptidase I